MKVVPRRNLSHCFCAIIDNSEQVSQITVNFKDLSQNELEKITKMINLLQNELEQIAKMKCIKNYKNLSKEELLIALLKSERSQAEHYKSKSYNAEIEETNILTN